MEGEAYCSSLNHPCDSMPWVTPALRQSPVSVSVVLLYSYSCNGMPRSSSQLFTVSLSPLAIKKISLTLHLRYLKFMVSGVGLSVSQICPALRV